MLKFDPAAHDGSSAHFNPLLEIRLGGDREVGDAQNIATMLVDPDGKGLTDHRTKTSQALLTGAILHCYYTHREGDRHSACLADVDELLAHPEFGHSGGPRADA
ncbi:MAG: type IV secretory system conjugative DNA transfer family protein [Herbaspirillum sp.]|nr:type IV secretory system conjugative DNA transfer family protein [Herbaspirillum sp.]